MSEVAPSHICRMCRKPVDPDARVCTSCGASQTLWGRIALVMKWIGAAATIVSLLIGMTSLWGLYDAQRNTRAAVKEFTDAADLLRDESNYARAWQLYDKAAELDASSPLVRRGREELAKEWVPRASVTGDEKFSTLVDQLLPVLLRGYQHSTGSKAADYLALSGWAHYLERRDRPFSTVDIPATYHRSLEIDNDNAYALIFLGHWLISEEENLDSGTEHFRRAVATGQQVRLARYYHASALQNMLSVSSSDTTQANRIYVAYLNLMNDMLKANEDLASTFPDNGRTVYESLSAYAKVPFDSLLSALSPLEHREVITKLSSLVSIKDSFGVLSGRLFTAQLLEHEGDKQGALSAFEMLGADVGRNSQLRESVDAGLERLSGSKTDIALERDNPLAFHTNSLKLAQFTDERFSRALRYFDNLSADALTWQEDGRIPAAISAMQYGVSRLLEAQGETDATYRDAAMSLGALQLGARALDDAIATYSTIASPPNAYERQRLHYNLACAYSLRSGTLILEPEIRKDLDASAEHFELAVTAGFTDWDHIKRDGDLNNLRNHATYRRLMSGR